MNIISYIRRETERDMSKTRKLYQGEATSQGLRLCFAGEAINEDNIA